MCVIHQKAQIMIILISQQKPTYIDTTRYTNWKVSYIWCRCLKQIGRYKYRTPFAGTINAKERLRKAHQNEMTDPQNINALEAAKYKLTTTLPQQKSYTTPKPSLTRMTLEDNPSAPVPPAPKHTSQDRDPPRNPPAKSPATSIPSRASAS